LNGIIIQNPYPENNKNRLQENKRYVKKMNTVSQELVFTDYKNHPLLWAKRIGVSLEAVELYLASEVIDLHTVSYMWNRGFGYDLAKKHHFKPLPVAGQVDFPKCLEANMAGIVWDITTNPFRKAESKLAITRKNIEKIKNDLEIQAKYFRHVVSYNDYLAARKENKVASWISLQGAQAIDNDLENLDKIPEVHRITLLHLTRSKLGISSFDYERKKGLTNFGKNFVEKMVEKKILVDLSHINYQGFFDALAAVPKGNPVVVTHTGVRGILNSWRNLDDLQIRAIAETGGTIGVIYYPKYLKKTLFSCTSAAIIEHMEYIIRLVGEDFVSLGSDYDGMISLPQDFYDITWQPVLVQRMLEKKWSEERIRKILGKNFLRVIKDYREE